MKVKLIRVNLLLCLLILFQGYMIYQVWSAPDYTDDLEISSGSATDSVGGQNLLKVAEPGQSKGNFSIVVNKNVFSMARKEFIAEGEPDTVLGGDSGKEKKKKDPLLLDSRQISLSGVIVVGDYCKALVSDASDREQPLKWVRHGDTVDEFVVKQIQKDRIIISGAGKRYTVLLYDKKNPKKRLAASTSRVATPVRGVKKSTKPPSASAKKEKPKANNNYEIIETPFGKFKRKKK